MLKKSLKFSNPQQAFMMAVIFSKIKYLHLSRHHRFKSLSHKQYLKLSHEKSKETKTKLNKQSQSYW